MQDQIYHMLVEKDDVTWQSIIYDLVKSEQMDPWDIDISILSQKYLERIKNLVEHNFFISGKILLASAILLKLKSIKFVDEHIAGFDSLLFAREEDLYDEPASPFAAEEIPPLLIKTPQQRKRKVSIQDLMQALSAALHVEERRTIRKLKERVVREVYLPTTKVDIATHIRNLYHQIIGWFTSNTTLTFQQLLPENAPKKDVLLTFVPMLYLSNQQKIDINQEHAFGQIDITLKKLEEEHEKQPENHS
ncbi:MAG TPA: segregation/condensation protein A [Candidatus Nanoarchaeia archaeon]|nr:segregation/condensation protein A [Candidatus Nanoarchaeia archaeon]